MTKERLLLLSCLKGLVSHTCMRVVYARHTAPSVSLKFTETGSAPLQELRALSDLETVSLPGLFLDSAPWRVGHKGKYVCGSSDWHDSYGTYSEGLSCLLFKKCLKVSVVNDYGDSNVTFEDGYALSIFCNQYQFFGKDAGEFFEHRNFTVFGTGYYVTVGPRCVISREPRTRRAP